MAEKHASRTSSNPKIEEKNLDPVGANVSYGLIVQKRISGMVQVVTMVADRPITVPAVGETFELQGTADQRAGPENLDRTISGVSA